MRIVLLLLGLICCAYVNAQKSPYVKLHGDTFVMNMLKGWEPCTGEKIYKKYARRKLYGYETTCITRVRSKRSVNDMGGSISIIEFKGCKNHESIQKQDSISFLNTSKLNSVSWGSLNSGKVKRSVMQVFKSEKHPETGENQILRVKTWYVQGKANTYVISFATTEDWVWKNDLQEMERIVFSLIET